MRWKERRAGRYDGGYTTDGRMYHTEEHNKKATRKEVSDVFAGQLALIYIHAVVPTVLLVKVV